MQLIRLILAAFFSGISLGYAKFYFLGYLSNEVYQPADKVWIIQTVGALITFGPCLAYVFASPIASSYLKARIMRLAGYSASLAMLIGLTSGWAGSAWLYVILAGFIMGIFNPAKNAAVPLQAKQTGRTTEAVNASLSIAYIFGILGGTPLATALVELYPVIGGIIGAGFFFFGGVFGGQCRYIAEPSHLHPFKDSVRNLLRDTSYLFRNYANFIIGPTMIWGMASATSLALTAYAEERHLGNAVACSLMAVYAVVGVIVGNVITPMLRSVRYIVATTATFLMVVLIVAMPALVEWLNPSLSMEANRHIYIALALCVMLLGLLFGIATNLIESEYLRLVHDEKKEGTGAAVLSAMTAFFPTLFGGLIAIAIIRQWATPITQFRWLAVLTLIAAVLILKLTLRQSGGAKGAFYSLIAGLVRLLLRIRYKVEIKGLETISDKRGILILPNHPAEMDPVLLVAYLWEQLHPGPVVLEKYYYLRGAHWLLKLAGAVPMPDMEIEPGPSKRRRVTRAMREVGRRLAGGGNILFYPSGRLMTSPRERLGGTSGAYTILKEVPNARIALIRTTGLYGSSFSRAFSSSVSPDFWRTVARNLWTVLKNLVLFVPKRKVTVEILFEPETLPRSGSSLELNRFLEDWFNRGAPAEPLLVSRSFWREDFPALPPAPSSKELLDSSDPAVVSAVVKKLSELSGIDAAQITPENQVGADLGLDSLAMSEVLIWLDQTFEISDVQLAELSTVAGIIRAASGGAARSAEKEAALASDKWAKDAQTRPPPVLPEYPTIQEAFLYTADRMGSAFAVADSRSGPLTWHRVKVAVLLLAGMIKKLEG